jgi:deglycase
VTVAGGKYMNIPVTEAYIDGNLVTAPAWPAHPAWIAKVLQVLEAETYEKAGRA